MVMAATAGESIITQGEEGSDFYMIKQPGFKDFKALTFCW